MRFTGLAKIKSTNNLPDGTTELIFVDGSRKIVSNEGNGKKSKAAIDRKGFGKALFNAFQLYTPDELVSETNRVLNKTRPEGSLPIDLADMFNSRGAGERITMLDLLTARVAYDAIVNGKQADKSLLFNYMFGKPNQSFTMDKPESENLDAINSLSNEEQTKVIQLLAKYDIKDIAEAISILKKEKEISGS